MRQVSEAKRVNAARRGLGQPLLWFAALAIACSPPALEHLNLGPGHIEAKPTPSAPPVKSPPRPQASLTPPPLVKRAPAPPSDSQSLEPRAPVRPIAKPTPLSEVAVAAHIADAWKSIVGEHIQRETLAVLWAHAALETGRGQKMIGFNFAGIKGQTPNGDGRPLWTWERTSAGPERVRRTFRVYPSAQHGARDYIHLLTTKYSRARRAAERGSPGDFVAALADKAYFSHDAEQYTRSVTRLTLEYLKKNPL